MRWWCSHSFSVRVRGNELEILEYFAFIEVSSLHKGATKKRGVISESVTPQWNRRNRYHTHLYSCILSHLQPKSSRLENIVASHRKQLDETTSHPLSGSGHTCPLIHPKKKSAWQSCFPKHPRKHQPSSYGPGRSSKALLFQHVIQSVQLPAYWSKGRRLNDVTVRLVRLQVGSWNQKTHQTHLFNSLKASVSWGFAPSKFQPFFKGLGKTSPFFNYHQRYQPPRDRGCGMMTLQVARFTNQWLTKRVIWP